MYDIVPVRGDPIGVSVKLVRDVLLTYEGEIFTQKKGQRFTYKVKGNSIVPSTTNYHIPIKDILKGLNRSNINKVSDLSDLRGPSYIYALVMDSRIKNSLKNIC